ncbi:MAG: hypothetical protein U5M72_00265 [Pseudomonas sp.]|nr:hypothetical protein [Pseudomonas sp.]
MRDGVVSLGMPTGEATPEPGEIKVRSRRQQFGDELWGRY